MESKTPFANRAVVATALPRLLRLLYERTLLVLTIMFCIGIAIILWHVSRLQANLVESVTLDACLTVRPSTGGVSHPLYGGSWGRARTAGVEVTHDYAAKEGAIPLPATLTILFGATSLLRVPVRKAGCTVTPRFPRGRMADRRTPLNDRRWNPCGDTRSGPCARGIIPGPPRLALCHGGRHARQCLGCHNTHPASPKTTWQEGDVRGVLEVIVPWRRRRETPANLRETFYLMAAMSLFGLGGLALMIGTVRRYTADAQRLAQEATRANEVNRLKTEFVTVVSHELRTPLTSITGYVELLLEEQGDRLTGAQRESLGIVQRNAEQLVALIEDLLDISRLEAGRLEVKRATLDLCRLIREVARSLRPQLEAKGQRLTLDLAETLPTKSGDADRVRQILTNLLSNAHKYTRPRGSITVTARGEAGRVRVSVQDTGVGLSPDDQARLFTKFFRAQNRVTQGVSGTGLGLAITQGALVELHGGEITVTSALGQGSTFSIVL